MAGVGTVGGTLGSITPTVHLACDASPVPCGATTTTVSTTTSTTATPPPPCTDRFDYMASERRAIEPQGASGASTINLAQTATCMQRTDDGQACAVWHTVIHEDAVGDDGKMVTCDYDSETGGNCLPDQFRYAFEVACLEDGTPVWPNGQNYLVSVYDYTSPDGPPRLAERAMFSCDNCRCALPLQGANLPSFAPKCCLSACPFSIDMCSVAGSGDSFATCEPAQGVCAMWQFQEGGPCTPIP
jgi:hypothetical protein